MDFNTTTKILTFYETQSTCFQSTGLITTVFKTQDYHVAIIYLRLHSGSLQLFFFNAYSDE